MASTLSRPSLSLSLAVMLPHVYITPPAEELVEPYLCFDPNDPLNDPYNEFDAPSSPESDSFDLSYHMQACSPDDSHCPIALPPTTCDSTRALVDALVNESLGELDQDDSASTPRGRRTYIQSREPGNDSEVIEVVKLGRSSDNDKPAPVVRPKRSKSFLSRAFKSLKTVAKSSKSPEATTPRVSVESQSQDSYRSSWITRKRTISRPNSILTSPSVSSFRSETCAPSDMDMDSRAASPAPSTYTTLTTQSSFKKARRFSVLSLSKLFKAPSQTSLSQTDELGQPRDSESNGPSTDSSTTSSSIPSTPVNGMFTLPSSSSLGKVNSSSVGTDDGDASFEMRLDSLHFDSLSFDPSEFSTRS